MSYGDEAAILSDDSDAGKAAADQSSTGAKEEEEEEPLEESAGFFDDLHSRIAPSRSLKRHLFLPDVLERYALHRWGTRMHKQCHNTLLCAA